MKRSTKEVLSQSRAEGLRKLEQGGMVRRAVLKSLYPVTLFEY